MKVLFKKNEIYSSKNKRNSIKHRIPNLILFRMAKIFFDYLKK